MKKTKTFKCEKAEVIVIVEVLEYPIWYIDVNYFLTAETDHLYGYYSIMARSVKTLHELNILNQDEANEIVRYMEETNKTVVVLWNE